MASWTEEQIAQATAAYKAGNPTPENSTELIKAIAEEMDQSPNGVRMILVRAGVYVKKDTATGGATKKEGAAEGTKRVSKEAQIAALAAVIEEMGAPVDQDVLDKLTGKAAAYFVTVLKSK